MKKQLVCLLLALVLLVAAACQKQYASTPPASSLPPSSSDTPQKPSFLYDSNRLTLYMHNEDKKYNIIEVEVTDPNIDIYGILDILRQQYASTEYFQNESFSTGQIGILEVNSLTHDNEALIVDFKANSAPVIAVGSTLESSMLATVGATFIHNARGVEYLIFRVDGKPYESGHLSFKENEPYNPPPV